MKDSRELARVPVSEVAEAVERTADAYWRLEQYLLARDHSEDCAWRCYVEECDVLHHCDSSDHEEVFASMTGHARLG